METNKIRNVAILGHLQSGKTTLVEALYSKITGAPKGSVEKGNTISDYQPEEKAKMNSIKSSIIPMFFICKILITSTSPLIYIYKYTFGNIIL